VQLVRSSLADDLSRFLERPALYGQRRRCTQTVRLSVRLRMAMIILPLLIPVERGKNTSLHREVSMADTDYAYPHLLSTPAELQDRLSDLCLWVIDTRTGKVVMRRTA
jgi:hypothetical protein